MRSAAEEERADENRRRAQQDAGPTPGIESREPADHESAARRCIDVDPIAGGLSEPAEIGGRLRLESRAAMRDYERQGRLAHRRRRAGVPIRLLESAQTFSGSVARRFIRSAGTGRPWPKPRRFAGPAEGVRAEPGADALSVFAATGGWSGFSA